MCRQCGRRFALRPRLAPHSECSWECCPGCRPARRPSLPARQKSRSCESPTWDAPPLNLKPKELTRTLAPPGWAVKTVLDSWIPHSPHVPLKRRFDTPGAKHAFDLADLTRLAPKRAFEANKSDD